MSANYKDTLLLPKTDFPMKADLVKREPERLARWEAAGLYQQILDARIGAPLFVLHDGPPFANGDVHMGTALNKILKDLIVKSRTMLGFRAPFVPGWDCHGLPIEFKVVKEQRGLEPAEIRRRAEAFARKYIDIQRSQFKRLGVFGSWEDPYLTLAPSYEADILRAFAGFVEKGLVYQSKKPVYWSTGAQTALAEAEVEYAQRTDPAVYVKFQLTEISLARLDLTKPTALVIWTTTPWTLPANVAVALSPKAEYLVADFADDSGQTQSLIIAQDLLEEFEKATGLKSRPLSEEEIQEREVKGLPLFPYGEPHWRPKFAALFKGTEPSAKGAKAKHPFLQREVEIIYADFVTLDTGTGQVHIAPGHGKDDYIAGMENSLPVISPVDDFGRFVQLDPEHGQMPEAWLGKEVAPMNPKAPDSANAAVIEELEKRGALLAVEWTAHDYPHCWRSKTPIVFRAVEQFFIDVDAIRKGALAAIDETTWLPHWGRNRIYGTVESRPDWCISRQRTWGVPLPVFYDEKGIVVLDPNLINEVAKVIEEHGSNIWFEGDDDFWRTLLILPEGYTRRNDTLDVWIDSGVSHQAVTSRHPELKACGGVADVYLEATDQHRGWFQSSLMTSVALTGHAPYKTVITHGFVVDKDTKKKVSKSDQGTAGYKKPMEADYFVGKYGADIVRLWAASVEFTNDVPFSEDGFTRTSEAYRSFRNIFRILLANLSGFTPEQASLAGATTVDRWVLSKLQGVIATARTAYEAYDFRRVFEVVNQFCTVDLSSLYVDITKDRMYCDAANSPRRRATQTVMHACFEAIAKMLAPILAYTADEAWEFVGHTTSIHIEHFPEADPALRDEALETEVEEWLKLRAAVMQQAIEPARQAKTIAKSLEGSVTLEVADAARAALEAKRAELEEFFIISDLILIPGPEPRATVARSSHQGCARCWRFVPSVGTILAQSELCDRCADVVS